MAANRGEWTELYVLFKLLGDGVIYAADEQMNKNPASYLEILKVLREEVKDVLTEYRTGSSVEVYVGGEKMLNVPAEAFLERSEALLQTIQRSKGPSFNVDEDMRAFMKRVCIKHIKAQSVSGGGLYGGKNDIVMQIRDHTTALVSVAGFSIKAKGTNPATLFNTSVASAFVYELSGMDDQRMAAINSLCTKQGGKDKAARMDYLRANGIQMNFVGTHLPTNADYRVFEANLDMIRGDMKDILNQVLLIHYTHKKNNAKLRDICQVLTDENPLGKRTPALFYQKAIKDFLYAAFSGMTAGSEWNGMATVNGGYIIAKENGEVLAYHTRDSESFKTYLFNNTKIDRPSASENKGYPYAHVYKENGRYYFDLNFQVRFVD